VTLTPLAFVVLQSASTVLYFGLFVESQQCGPLNSNVLLPVCEFTILLYLSHALTFISNNVPALCIVGDPVFPFPASKVCPGKVITNFSKSSGLTIILVVAETRPVEDAVIVHSPAVSS